MKQTLIRLHWIFSSQFGLDPLSFFRSLRGLWPYLREWRQFRSVFDGVMRFKPCLHDRFDEAGITKSEYFWQDLLVARWIFEANANTHVDVGSRIDGFVAHVASFREIEVFDVRPVSTSIPGVFFRQVDLTNAESINSIVAKEDGYCDSLSCLHALEHFGLGRYGDTINPRGYVQGIAHLAKLIKPGGKLYLSTPIGQERVEFNANWVFDPRTILGLTEQYGLALERLTVFGHDQGLLEVEPAPSVLEQLAAQRYHLGIFVFSKVKKHRRNV